MLQVSEATAGLLNSPAAPQLGPFDVPTALDTAAANRPVHISANAAGHFCPSRLFAALDRLQSKDGKSTSTDAALMESDSGLGKPVSNSGLAQPHVQQGRTSAAVVGLDNNAGGLTAFDRVRRCLAGFDEQLVALSGGALRKDNTAAELLELQTLISGGLAQPDVQPGSFNGAVLGLDNNASGLTAARRITEYLASCDAKLEALIGGALTSDHAAGVLPQLQPVERQPIMHRNVAASEESRDHGLSGLLSPSPRPSLRSMHSMHRDGLGSNTNVLDRPTLPSMQSSMQSNSASGLHNGLTEFAASRPSVQLTVDRKADASEMPPPPSRKRGARVMLEGSYGDSPKVQPSKRIHLTAYAGINASFAAGKGSNGLNHQDMQTSDLSDAVMSDGQQNEGRMGYTDAPMHKLLRVKRPVNNSVRQH